MARLETKTKIAPFTPQSIEAVAEVLGDTDQGLTGTQRDSMPSFPSGRSTPSRSAALDWIALGREAMPNAKPLSADERATVTEYFWSLFK